MQKINIQNRKGQKIAVIVEEKPKAKGLAFVMHGLGGFKEQPHIETMAKSFKGAGMTVIRFDTTNTLGESDGDYADATVTNYYQDLEDVIAWAKNQSWYQEPFYLAGHSLGAGCVALYAENYLGKVKALAPISSVVSGKLSFEAHPKEELDEWKKSGWRATLNNEGVEKRLKWSHMEDRLKYDLLLKADKLIMPTLLIVGEKDHPDTTKKLYNKLPGKKELHIIKNGPHTFVDPKHLKKINRIFKRL